MTIKSRFKSSMTTDNWNDFRNKLSIIIEKYQHSDYMNDEEREIFDKSEIRCGNIRNVTDMNICLLFWQKTNDKKYWNYIKSIYDCPLDSMYPHAKIIIDNE